MNETPSKILASADTYRKAMESHLDKLNIRIISKLRDDSAYLVYQSGDGWCIHYADGLNARITEKDLDQFFTMKKAAALAFLKEKQI